MNRILVIDDDSLARTMVTRTLQKEGFSVSEASNGTDGLTMIDGQSFDLVITDMMMPCINGMQTIAVLQEKHEKIRILAISGGGTQKNVALLDTAKSLGAHHVLTKPFNPSDLLDAVQKALV